MQKQMTNPMNGHFNSINKKTHTDLSIETSMYPSISVH